MVDITQNFLAALRSLAPVDPSGKIVPTLELRQATEKGELDKIIMDARQKAAKARKG